MSSASPAIDVALLAPGLAGVADRARDLEQLGADGLFTFEGPTEPFTPLFLAATTTERVSLATGVAVAFARNPMIVAQLAHELQELSAGRHILGIGSQVKAHIERRFSEDWGRPTARMRDFVRAIRAIWACWNDGERLNFEGEFYTHTLMNPLFHPAPHGHPSPPIYVAGVGAAMTEVAGEVADGLYLHPMTTLRSFAETTKPAVARGAARAGRPSEDVALAFQVMVATGFNEDDIATAREFIRRQIAFYGSTPAYRSVLEAEGRGELHTELHAMSRAARWAEMTGLVDDELLEAVAVVGKPRDVGRLVRERYGAVASRIGLTFLVPPGDEVVADVIAAIRED